MLNLANFILGNYGIIEHQEKNRSNLIPGTGE